PKPTNDTLPPPLRVLPTLLTRDSNAFFAAPLEIPASAAIASINSDLFIIIVINCLVKIIVFLNLYYKFNRKFKLRNPPDPPRLAGLSEARGPRERPRRGARRALDPGGP